MTLSTPGWEAMGGAGVCFYEAFNSFFVNENFGEGTGEGKGYLVKRLAAACHGPAERVLG